MVMPILTQSLSPLWLQHTDYIDQVKYITPEGGVKSASLEEYNSLEKMVLLGRHFKETKCFIGNYILNIFKQHILSHF
jgi:hypothetical protein